jgi:phosphoenolpyruvate-protein kinase (PTS system EI component)
MPSRERVICGVAAAPGTATGAARLLSQPATTSGGPIPAERRAAELERAERALRDAAAELGSIAKRLRLEDRPAEAEVVETGLLMAADPSLKKEVEAAVRDQGESAPAAILLATEIHAAAIAQIDDPLLSARAADVRSLGNRAARLAGAPQSRAALEGPSVLVASDLGPADVAELGPEVVAIALAEGAVRAHAAIVARSLGMPMVVALGEQLLALSDGEALIVDGSAGLVTASPSAAELAAAQLASARRARAAERSAERRDLAAETADGRRLTVLANVASGAEVRLALAAGAEGAGLIRTELAFLETRAWPTEAEHRAALEPILAPLAGHPATVRVLDFGGDKTPPFLAGVRDRGIELMVHEPKRLEDQLRGILAAAAGKELDLRLLLPMVRSAADVAAVRAALHEPAAVGAMIETPDAADAAAQIATESDFLSIGTNDLTAAVLGVERFKSGESPTYHPAVLRAIAAVADAAAGAHIPLEVCGEAASDPITLPLLVGLGVDELSVGAARVGVVREWVRSLSHADSRELAERCLAASTALEVAAIVRPAARSLELLESGDSVGESVNGDGGVVAIGPQP